MSMTNVNFEIDGEEVSNQIIEKYLLKNNTRNLRFSYKTNSDVINFVGFDISNEETLVSFPKHYIDTENKNSLDQEDMSLLFKVLMLDQVKNVENYIGSVKEFESNFPFNSYYGIYKYFQQYGLYQESHSVIKKGYTGKIYWRETIRKANSFINEKNIIYLPLFIKETKNKQVFISECMSFAINYTLKRFPTFVTGKAPKCNYGTFDFLSNKESIVARLKKVHSELFKDIHKKLVYDLIEFFRGIPNGGSIIIKHYNFELAWESIVQEYLNNYFVKIEENGLIFSKEKLERLNSFKKEKFNVDKVHYNHRLEPDHYLKSNNNQYIFDAKYYTSINTLNYKQLGYHAILRSKASKTYSALILPTSKSNLFNVKHFELKDEYYSEPNDNIIIWECYLNMKYAMLMFLQ